MTRFLPFLLALSLIACGSETPAEKTTYLSDEFSAPEYLIEHGKYSEERVIRIGDTPVTVQTHVGGGISNSIVIEGTDGLIIVDTTMTLADGALALRRIREWTDKPIAAVIYTHHHADHVLGAGSFVSIEDAASGKVPVIAAENLMAELKAESVILGPVMGVRSLYMFGVLLDPETDGRHYHIGIGGQLNVGEAQMVEPNTLVTGTLDVEIAGVRLHLFQTGGEAASHMAVWLPDYHVMLAGDELQGPSFPNLHSLRGTKPRDANKWINAIDAMRAYEPEYLVSSHGPPVEGRAEVADVLTIYRDAIQWTHDQAIRLINQGLTGPELAEALPKLPAELDREPWTREMYGTVKHSVRNYLTGYISWWDGDPATLDPTPRVAAAGRTLALMGGRDRVLGAAQAALDAGDAQWASELATILIRVDHDDGEARALKARAFRRIGYATANPNWRGFYLTGARELDGLVDSIAIQKLIKSRFSFAGSDTRSVLDMLRYRVLPAEAEGKEITLHFRFPDRDEDWTLMLRHQIIEVREGAPAAANAVVTVDRALFEEILLGRASAAAELLTGGMSIDGEKTAFLGFFGALDTETHAINLVVR